MFPCRVTPGILLAVALSWMPTSLAAQQPPIQLPPPRVPVAARAFVSVSGDDGTACGPIWPCRSLAQALSVVSRGGEVVVLSSGDYDPFSLTKPVSVVAAPGVQAVITATTGNAINIETLGAVALRGLTLIGRGGDTGINVVGVDVLHVQDCVLDGFTGNAITFAGGGRLHLRDTTVKRSGSDFASAIYIANGAASIDRVRMDRNKHGLVVDLGQVTIRDSVATDQGLHAVWARGLNGPVDLAIENCRIEGSGLVNNGGAGILAGNPSGPSRGAKMSVSNSIVAGNEVGISASQSTGTATKIWVSNTTIIVSGHAIVSTGGAAILSRGNNTVEDNTPPGYDTFTGSYSAK